MRRTFERGTNARLSFSGGPHASVNMVDSMEEVNEGGEKCRKWRICCAVLRYISYAKSLKYIASLDPETVQLPTFSILSVMFTGACGRPEKISLALVPYSNVLHMIVKLAYKI